MNLPVTVFESFAATAESAGHLPLLAMPASPAHAQRADGVEFSYRDAARIVRHLATAYESAGYRPGHRVGLVLGNCPEHFWHLLALNAIGVCAVPLNPDYLAHDVLHAIELADLCLVVVGGGPAIDAVASATAQIREPVPIWRLDADAGPPAPRRAPGVCVESPLERECLIIFTSGTTSRPKGCRITNHSCLESGRSYASVGGLLSLERESTRLYIPLPTFHMNATVLAFNAMLQTRGCLILSERFSASAWWREIRETRATGFHYLGLIPPLLLKAPLSGDDGRHELRFGLGAGVDPAVHRSFEERFNVPLVECWGMTETSRLIANAHEPRSVDTRAFGRPHAPLEVMVADVLGQPVAPGEAGELLVRCQGRNPRDGFFSGYVNDDDATSHAWFGDWFHTGDIVRQSPDGMLTFVERRKNIIRRSGENIAAAEIEEALSLSDDIREVVVLGVPDALRDEEPLACIVLQEFVEPTPEVAQRIVACLKGRLAMHKFPGWIQFVDSVPVTSTQKVRKDQLLLNFDPVGGDHVHDMRAFKQNRRARTASTI